MGESFEIVLNAVVVILRLVFNYRKFCESLLILPVGGDETQTYLENNCSITEGDVN